MLDSAVQQAEADAAERYPEESCGVVIAGEYVPRDNVAADPRAHFEMEEPLGDEVEAVIHSHPDGSSAPSQDDMRAQLSSAVPWCILATHGDQVVSREWFGDQVPHPPLLGRSYLSGIRDCYELVRHYYMDEHGYNLRQFPRDDNWWDDAESYFTVRNAVEAGAEEVSIRDAREGDVLLFALRSSVPNHCAILKSDGTILHHMINRLSRHEPVGPWVKHCWHVLRPRGIS